MKHRVIVEMEQNLGDFIWDVLPSLTRDERDELYQALLVTMRLAIREVLREGKEQWLKCATERSKN